MKYEYCPNGNYWSDVSGVFDERTYYFCDCNLCGGKLYELRPTDVTNKLGEESLERARQRVRCDQVKRSINYKNMEAVAKITNPEKQ